MKQMLLAALTAWCLGCEDEGVPPVYTSSVQLAVEDAGVTDVWFRMSFADSAAPRAFALRRDGGTVLTGTVTGREMIVGDTTAAPGHSYGYRVFRLNGTTAMDSSPVVQVTTLDTTSHIFSQMRIDTLGVTSSELYDVAIINDTLIYAVGEMYLRDSTGGVDPQPYNMAKWNGTGWQLMRIQFYTICGQMSRTPYPAGSVFAFSATDVWITSRGGQLARWNGTTQTATICNPDPFVIYKIWGENPNSIWAVGLGGRIGHYVNGTNWRRLESGTTVNLNDIWGSVDTRTGKRIILCAASNAAQLGERKILSITAQNSVDTIAWTPQREVQSVWFQSAARLFACGDGLFVRRLDEQWRQATGLPLLFKERVRGQAVNDMFVVGDFGLVAHYNGASWCTYPNVAVADVYKSVDQRNGFVVAVGFAGSRAVALQMRR